MTISLTVYSYEKCGTCRKAIAWLNLNKIDYKLIDIIDSPPSKKDISEGIKQLGNVKYLLNTSGKSYRTIGASVIKSMSKNEVIDLLSSDSRLLKRPFVKSHNGIITVGFKEISWESTFLN